MSVEMPFDRLVLEEPNGARVISLATFLGLPIHERTRYILRQEVAFFRGDVPVDRKVALRAIMRAAQTASQNDG
jgi:hypothetical protein